MADNRASCWSVTINNPTKADYEEIDSARQRGWKVDGQVEKGAEGTYHLQLMVRTPQVRFAAVKKMFSRAHIEPARNVAALANYVGKEETRAAALPTGSNRYPSLSKFWELVAIQMNHGRSGWTDDDKEAFYHPDLMHPDDGYLPNRVYFFDPHLDKMYASDPLRFFDAIVEYLIGQGYYVEAHAANPAVRSSYKKWWRSILYRAMETVRQTDSVQSVQIPVVEVEHNQLDADDSARQEASPRVLEELHPEQENESVCSCCEESCTPCPEGCGDDCKARSCRCAEN